MLLRRLICLTYDILFCEFLVVPVDIGSPYMALKQSRCSLSIGKIALVQMAGEQGSYIRDDIQTNAISNNEQNRQQVTVTLYEDTTYRLHVQFNCDRQSACDLSQNVNAWIDFNDDGYDEDGESRVSTRPSSNNYNTGGTHDVEVYVPSIDGWRTKTGPHRMRLTVTPSEEYQRDCGSIDYPETRDYTINIVPKARYPGKSLSVELFIGSSTLMKDMYLTYRFSFLSDKYVQEMRFTCD